MELTCKYCYKVCKNLNAQRQHEIRCKENPDKISLDYMNTESYKNKVSPKLQVCCIFCKKEFTSFQSITNHTLRCIKNPNKQSRPPTDISLYNYNELSKLGILAKYGELIQKEFTCIHCNTLFKITEREFANYPHKYCSKSCCSEYTRKLTSERYKLEYKTGKRHAPTSWRAPWYYYKDFRGGILTVQGSYEYRTCFILQSMKDKGLILNWEYTLDRIPYKDGDGKNHTYLLDFKIFNKENEFYYLEIKGKVGPLDCYKWDAVITQGFGFEVWYLNDIRQKERELNIKNIWKETLKKQENEIPCLLNNKLVEVGRIAPPS